jgi:stage II sporulation protein P
MGGLVSVKRNSNNERSRFFSRILPIFAVMLCLVILLSNTEGESVYERLLSLKMPALFASDEDTHTQAEPAKPRLEITSIVDIDKNVKESIRVELLRTTTAEAIDLSGSAPRVLIYHTHATEAYTVTPGYEYESSGEWRTYDQTRSVVAVGERLAKLLTEKYGISVIHDTTNHEPPKLSTAYSRSVETMEKYKAEYPSLTTFIDVHRDAYGTAESGKSDYVTIDGKPVARLMFVVGTGEGATGSGFGEMPDFTSNFALASAISEKLESFAKGFTRNIRVKTGRYNQHISSQCLLVEVGHNANTLEQALNAMDYLAAAIASVASIEGSGSAATPPVWGATTPGVPTASPAVTNTPAVSPTAEVTPSASPATTPGASATPAPSPTPQKSISWAP